MTASNEGAGPEEPVASRGDVVFAPVARNERLADKVTAQLLESIRSWQLAPGSRLPSERELAEQFGVSRTVIREAVRSLAAKGVVAVRSGSGVHVVAVGPSQVSEQMNLFLHGHGPIDYAQINEVRTMLEIRTAGLAAERATEADIEELRLHCDRMEAAGDDVETASIEDVEFHRAIARATHNDLFLLMLDSIGDVLLAIRRATLGAPGRLPLGVAFHRRILHRVEAHDVTGTERAMREHLLDADIAWEGLPDEQRTAAGSS
jgi:GntR family transcriptional repressor for pyruvate dehydrogenase complex